MKKKSFEQEKNKLENILKYRKKFVDLIIQNMNENNIYNTNHKSMLYWVCEVLKNVFKIVLENKKLGEQYLKETYLNVLLYDITYDPKLIKHENIKYAIVDGNSSAYDANHETDLYIINPKHYNPMYLLRYIFNDDSRKYKINIDQSGKITLVEGQGGKKGSKQMNKFQKFCNKYSNIHH